MIVGYKKTLHQAADSSFTALGILAPLLQASRFFFLLKVSPL